jgi:hypothetical protein
MKRVPLKGRVMGVLPVWMQSAIDFLWGERLPKNGIDLGNGRVLEPEDVLEGHYRRLSKQRQPATRQAVVQVGDNLNAAISVLAPELTPLTEVAEEVSGAVPHVEPDHRFREHLHEALERTHRQHTAQRILGTRPLPRKRTNPVNWWMVVAGVVAMLALVWGWRSRQSAASA